MQNSDTESHNSQFEWTLHRELRKNFLLEKKSTINWLIYPLGFVFRRDIQKTCNIIDECTVENERSETECIYRWCCWIVSSTTYKVPGFCYRYLDFLFLVFVPGD